MRDTNSKQLVDLGTIPVNPAWESPIIHAHRYKQGGVQWSLSPYPTPAGPLAPPTGVVNPLTARVVGTMYGPEVIAKQHARSAPYDYDLFGYATVAGNPQLWKDLTWASFSSLPNNSADTDTIEIINTRGYNYFRLVWEITTELRAFTLATSFLGD